MVRRGLPAFAALFLTVLLIAAFRPIDHDEGQYVAAVALMRTGLPFRDFAYLQTPLQPLLFAPLAWLCEGWLFPALRAANAACAAGAALLLAVAARRAGGSPRAAGWAMAGLCASHAFLFAATVARNDALPLLLHVAGLALFLPVARGAARPGAAFAAGLALAAAASAKISYALPALAVGSFALLHARRTGWRIVGALAAGGVAGLVPVLLLGMLAPDAAWFGMIDYSLKAPFEWRMLNGQAAMLGWPLSLLRLLRFLAQGCGLLALAALLVDRWRPRGGEAGVRCLLDMMIVAGLLAAWAPRPVYVQYLLPLLPALMLRFGLLLDDARWRGVVAPFLIAGVAQTAIETVSNIARGDSPVLALRRDAQAVGRIMGAAGPIVTLSPERVVDSGVPLDPRFAAGPFLFRTRDVLTDEQAARFHVVTLRSVAAALAGAPPAAILTGYEGQPTPAMPHGLEAPLRDWALRHGYRAVTLPSGGATLFLSPYGHGGALPRPERERAMARERAAGA
jgi:hypothetical protein